MRLLTCCLLIALVLFAVPAMAYDVLVLQALREKGYDEAVKGLKRECRASTRTVVLSDFAEADITRIIREEHPRLVVAVGDRAVDLADNVRHIPVLYMMALNPKSLRPNVTGVSMLLDPAKYVNVFKDLKARRVAVLYDPMRNGAYVRRAQAAARRSGMELVMREVRNPRETPGALETLRGKCDVLWMLPDLTAVTPATTEAYFLFSQSERVPVVTFSDVYLSMGGAVALSIDRFDIGRQLGEMAQSVLEGTSVDELGQQSPRRALFKSNEGVLRRLKTMLGMAQ